MKKFLVFLLIFPSVVFAGGEVRVDGMGPEALGRGGASNALFDSERIEGAAIYYNVAQFGWLDGSLFQTGFDLVAPSFDYENGRGCLESKDQVFALPQLVFASKAGETDWIFFSGIYSPFGLGATNPEDWRPGLGFRKSQIGLINFTWGLAKKIDPDWSIGAGLDIGFGQMKYGTSLHQLSARPINSVYLETKEDGFGLSGRLGLLWQPSDNFSWGLSLSLPQRVAFTGYTDMYLWGLPLGRDKNDTAFTFPGRLGTGIAFALGPKLKLGADFNFYFGRQAEMKMNYRLLPTISQKMDWQNNFSAHFGAEYCLSDRATLRAGFAYLTNAVPDETVNPAIPDYEHGFGAGLGIGWQITKPENGKKPAWFLDVAYNYSWATAREIKKGRENLSPGKYDFSGHVLSVGLSCRF